MVFIKKLSEVFLSAESWNIDNILTFISLLFAVIGGGFALKQWINSNRVRRVEFLDKCIEKIRFTDDFKEILFMIDYDQFWYSPEFHGSDIEPRVDSFLSYLSYICYLRKCRYLSKKDILILDYFIRRTCISYSTQSYLWNFYHWSCSQNTVCSFSHLIEYGIQNKLIDKKEFMDINSNEYIRGLHIPTSTR